MCVINERVICLDKCCALLENCERRCSRKVLKEVVYFGDPELLGTSAVMVGFCRLHMQENG